MLKVPPKLILQVWDNDKFSADDFLGESRFLPRVSWGHSRVMGSTYQWWGASTTDGEHPQGDIEQPQVIKSTHEVTGSTHVMGSTH